MSFNTAKRNLLSPQYSFEYTTFGQKGHQGYYHGAQHVTAFEGSLDNPLHPANTKQQERKLKEKPTNRTNDVNAAIKELQKDLEMLLENTEEALRALE